MQDVNKLADLIRELIYGDKRDFVRYEPCIEVDKEVYLYITETTPIHDSDERFADALEAQFTLRRYCEDKGNKRLLASVLKTLEALNSIGVSEVHLHWQADSWPVIETKFPSSIT